MNLFNRIAVSLVLLIFIVVTLLVSLLPWEVIQWGRALLESAALNLNPMTQLLSAVIGLLAAVAAFLLLVAELRPPARHTVIVAQVASGTAELSNESVAMRVRRAAEGVEGVREVVPTIRSRGKAIDILLRISTDPDIDLPQKTEEVMQAVRSEAETKMGIPVKGLRVTVKHGNYDRRPAAQTPPAAPKDPFRGS